MGHADHRDAGVYRLGFEQAKRYLLTSDEIRVPRVAGIGLISERVPDDQLLDHATALAKRMAVLPGNQLEMAELLCNQTAEKHGSACQRHPRHIPRRRGPANQEGHDFVARTRAVGVRQAVRERDDPFGDRGSRFAR